MFIGITEAGSPGPRIDCGSNIAHTVAKANTSRWQRGSYGWLIFSEKPAGGGSKRERSRNPEPLVADSTLRIDEDCGGCASNAPEGSDSPGVRPGYREREVPLIEVLMHQRGVSIHGYGQHLDTVRVAVPVEPVESWHLDLARPAPGGPEVNHDNLATQVRQANRIPGEASERHVLGQRRSVSGARPEHRTHLRAEPGCQQHQEDDPNSPFHPAGPASR